MADLPKIELVPIGGVNLTDNYARLGPGQVFGSTNVLFERGMCVNRPGTSNLLTGLTSKVLFMENAYPTYLGTSQKWLFAVTQAAKLYFSGAAGLSLAFGEIPPDATVLALGAQDFNNITSALGAVIIGNNPGGFIVWDLNVTADYKIIAAGDYRYFAAHQGRVVAAYAHTGAYGPITFAWCKPGDYTDWLEADGAAGNEVIAESVGEITGLGVLHNIVVILRQYGVHLAYPTGQLPPYNLQAFHTKGNGCYYPSTAAWDDECTIYCGLEDVYMFDLQTITPIGYEIRDLLFLALRNGVLYRGLFTKATINGATRFRYHLRPLNLDGSKIAFHFSYDMLEKKWSVHRYPDTGVGTASWAFNWITLGNHPDNGLSWVDTDATSKVVYWDNNQIPSGDNEESTINAYMGIAEALEKDFTVQDVLIRNKDYGAGDATTYSINLQAQLNLQQVASGVTAACGKNNSQQWVMNWPSRKAATAGNTLRLTGNNFVLTVTAKPGSRFAVDYLALLYNQTSDNRGS